MQTEWKFCGACFDSEPFEIGGLNVWACEWVRVPNEVASVRDPNYHQPHEFNVYNLVQNARAVRVAAGEFSNCVWGFYVPKQA
jgi:hypothetical protein